MFILFGTCQPSLGAVDVHILAKDTLIIMFDPRIGPDNDVPWKVLSANKSTTRWCYRLRTEAYNGRFAHGFFDRGIEIANLL